MQAASGSEGAIEGDHVHEPRTWLLVIIGLGIVGLTSYWLGLRQGAVFGMAFSSALKGYGSVDSLSALRDGKVEVLAAGMESEADSALYINHDLEDTPAFRFLPLPWGSDVEAYRRKSLTHVADYRKEHPSPMSPEAFDALFAQVPESQRKSLPTIDPSTRETMVKMQETIADMVRRYASKSSQTK